MAPTIVVGHYGSGKTEFAANYVRRLLQTGHMPIIADMDIVNPYFRLREKEDYYSQLGVKVVSSNYPGQHHLDAPALSSQLRYCFETAEDSVIDVGGDANGARVLAGYAHFLKERDYSMWMTVNANRPMTSNPQKVMEYINDIQQVSGLAVTGLLNTTHMMGETTPQDLKTGDMLVREVSANTGIPVKYTVYLDKMEPQPQQAEYEGELFPIQLQVRPAWL